MKNLIILALIISSCSPIVEKVETKSFIIANKEKCWRDGNTAYRIAFTDGNDCSVSFGIYSNYEKGDTIWFEGNPNYSLRYWSVIMKNK